MIHQSLDFGNVLTDMESAGIIVDKEHLAKQEKKAEEDKKVSEAGPYYTDRPSAPAITRKA
jgi:DNA polymerase I-like protein with 3'-5' exonuclease and polymerase domains